MEECNEIIEEVKILDNNEDKCSSCVLDIVLLSIFFIINVGIATYFAYYKYMNHNKENVSKYDYTLNMIIWLYINEHHMIYSHDEHHHIHIHNY